MRICVCVQIHMQTFQQKFARVRAIQSERCEGCEGVSECESDRERERVKVACNKVLVTELLKVGHNAGRGSSLGWRRGIIGMAGGTGCGLSGRAGGVEGK